MSEANEFERSACAKAVAAYASNSVVLVQQELLRGSAGLPLFCGEKIAAYASSSSAVIVQKELLHMFTRLL